MFQRTWQHFCFPLEEKRNCFSIKSASLFFLFFSLLFFLFFSFFFFFWGEKKNYQVFQKRKKNNLVFRSVLSLPLCNYLPSKVLFTDFWMLSLLKNNNWDSLQKKQFSLTMKTKISLKNVHCKNLMVKSLKNTK